MSTLPKTDPELLTLIKSSLYTPVIGDILDSIGLTNQFLPQEISGMLPTMRIAGRAMPVLIGDKFDHGDKPFGKLTAALDDLQVDEVYVARSGRLQCAAWGEILTATAVNRSAAGAVIDGFHRDTPRVLEQSFPVFSRGAYGPDAGVRASVTDYRVPIQIGGVALRPGDLVVGDYDGVVVVPRNVEEEVLERAIVKAHSENLVRDAIESGMSSTDAFEKFGVL